MSWSEFTSHLKPVPHVLHVVLCCVAMSTQAMRTESREPALPMASAALRAQDGEARGWIVDEQITSSNSSCWRVSSSDATPKRCPALD